MTKSDADATDPSHPAGSFRNLLEAFRTIRVPLAGHDAKAEAARRREAIAGMIRGQFSDAHWRHMMDRAHEAAERGEKDFLLLRIPAASCTDHGRAIIEREADWPATLTGEAAQVYRHWHDELRPQGFDLDARVLDFPGGMPGEVGLFLGWHK